MEIKKVTCIDQTMLYIDLTAKASMYLKHIVDAGPFLCKHGPWVVNIYICFQTVIYLQSFSLCRENKLSGNDYLLCHHIYQQYWSIESANAIPGPFLLNILTVFCPKTEIL